MVEVRGPSGQRRGIPPGVEFNHDEDLERGAGGEVSLTAALAEENQPDLEKGGNSGEHDQQIKNEASQSR